MPIESITSAMNASMSMWRAGASGIPLGDGDGAEAVVNGMAITDGTQRASNATTVCHHGEHTHSDQLFKYVADGESHGEFRGSIVVDESARFTEAYQHTESEGAGGRKPASERIAAGGVRR